MIKPSSDGGVDLGEGACRVVDGPVGQAVRHADQAVEQVTLRCCVSVTTGGAVGAGVVGEGGERPDVSGGRRWFFTLRVITVRLLPLARVIGADPA